MRYNQIAFSTKKKKKKMGVDSEKKKEICTKMIGSQCSTEVIFFFQRIVSAK